ncbi:hypothetical protein [Kocuria sp. KH4]
MTPNKSQALLAFAWEHVQYTSQYSMGVLALLVTSQQALTRDELAALAELPRATVDLAVHELADIGVDHLMEQQYPDLVALFHEDDVHPTVDESRAASEVVVRHVYPSGAVQAMDPQHTPTGAPIVWGTPDGALHQGVYTGGHAPTLSGPLALMQVDGSTRAWVTGGYTVGPQAHPHPARYRQARAQAQHHTLTRSAE